MHDLQDERFLAQPRFVFLVPRALFKDRVNAEFSLSDHNIVTLLSLRFDFAMTVVRTRPEQPFGHPPSALRKWSVVR